MTKTSVVTTALMMSTAVGLAVISTRFSGQSAQLESSGPNSAVTGDRIEVVQPITTIARSRPGPMRPVG